MSPFWILLAFVASVAAVPTPILDRFSCATTCKATPTKFAYKPGTTYTYDYVVRTDTTMAGASEDKATLLIKAKAEIASISPCEFTLTLKEVTALHSDGKTDMLTPAERNFELSSVLEQHTTHFSFDDGAIATICPAEEEELWAVNFKRGLLSAFQNNMDNFDKKTQTVPEVDVTGACEATYNVSESEGWFGSVQTNIMKTKNLLACTHRDNYKTLLQVVPYHVASDIQSVPILKSTHNCVYAVEKDVLTSAMCKESHIFVPFSNHKSGASTVVLQTLTFATDKQGVATNKYATLVKRGMLFEHADGFTHAEDGGEALTVKLEEICQQTQNDIRPSTPRLFTELVMTMKGVEHSELTVIYKHLKEGKICSGNGKGVQMFLDALPMTGSAGPVHMMVEVLTTEEVNTLRTKGWLATLALIKTPTADMIKSAKTLLTHGTELAREAKLHVASLVHMYCTPEMDCATNQDVKEIVKSISSSIDYYCSETSDDVLTSLRALGNLGLPVPDVIPTCLGSSSASLEVKLSALEAYHRAPCAGRSDDNLHSILTDTNSDAELRISAYLALMQCPTETLLNTVVASVNDKEDQQVASFISTHLTNLKETSDPHRQELARMVARLEFTETPYDAKLSRNMEASVLINRLNLGGVVNTDLIMAPNVPVPRAARLNLTMELFGNSVNALELGARMEGLEILVEKILGSYGITDEKSNKNLNDIKGSAYARVFGNEMWYQRMDGMPNLLPKLPTLPMNFLNDLSKWQKASYTHSQKLIDVTIVVPTIAGLPLNISINGSANMDLTAEGKVDLTSRSMEVEGEIKPSMAVEVTGSMMVDAHVTQLGLRMRNTLHSSTAVKGLMKARKGREFTLEVTPPKEKMEIFSARSQFFIKVNEVEKEQKMVKDNYQVQEMCSGPVMTQVAGAQLCSSLHFPNASMTPEAPYFPFTGPLNFTVTFDMLDTGRKVKVMAKRTTSKDTSMLQFIYNTPGSRTNRLVSADVTLTSGPDRSLSLILNSPWTKLNMESSLVNRKDVKAMTGSVTIDDKDKYGLTTELKLTREGRRVVYTPLIEVTIEGKTRDILSGNIDVLMHKKADVTLEIGTHKPITLTGELVNQEREKRIRMSYSQGRKVQYHFNIGTTIDLFNKDGKSFDLAPELEIRTPTKDLVFIKGSASYRMDKAAKGSLQINILNMKPAFVTFKSQQSGRARSSSFNMDARIKSSLASGAIGAVIMTNNRDRSAKVKGSYNIPQLNTKNAFSWNTKLMDRSKAWYKQVDIKSTFNNKQHPEYNMNLKFDLDHKRRHSETNLNLHYGADPKDNKKVVVLSAIVESTIKRWMDAKVDLTVLAKVPEQNVDVTLRTTHNAHKRDLHTHLILLAEPLMTQTLDLDLHLTDKSRKLVTWVGSASVGLGPKTFTVNTTALQKSQKQFMHNLTMTTPEGRQHSIETHYKTQNTERHEITSDVTIEGMKPMGLQGKVNLDPKNLQVFTSLTHNKDVYSFESKAKTAQYQIGKWEVNVNYPGRVIEASADATKSEDKYRAKAQLNWDAGRKSAKKSLVAVDGTYRFTSNGPVTLILGDLNMKTPFKKYEYFSSSVKYNEDDSQIDLNGRVAWQKKNNKISSHFLLNKPLTLTNVQVNFDAQTPFRKYKELGLVINHKVDDILTTILKGNKEEQNALFNLKGKSNGDLKDGIITGTIDITTPFETVRNLNMELKTKINVNRGHTSGFGSVSHNDRTFTTNYEVNQKTQGTDVDHKGALSFSWPEDHFNTTWSHTNTGLEKVASTFKSVLASDNTKHFNADFNMKHNVDGKKNMNINNIGMFSISSPQDTVKTSWMHKSAGLRTIQSSVDVKTTFESIRTLNMDLKNKFNINKGHFSGFGSVNHNDKTFTSNYEVNQNIQGDYPMWTIDHTGAFSMSWPEDHVNATWTHKNTGPWVFKNSFRSNLASDKTQHFNTDFNMDHSVHSDKKEFLNIDSTGTLIMSWPQDKLTTTWTHTSSGLRSIHSSLDASLAKDTTQRVSVTVSGVNKETLYRRTINGNVNLQTPIQAIKDMSMNLNFMTTQEEATISGRVSHNGQAYGTEYQGSQMTKRMDVDTKGAFSVSWPEDHFNTTWSHTNTGLEKVKSTFKSSLASDKTIYLNADFDMSNKIDAKNFVNKGKLSLSWPQDTLKTTWSHKSSGFKSIQSTLDASFNEDKNQRLFIDINGANEATRSTRAISGDLVIQTPYQTIKDVQVHMNNKIDYSQGEGIVSGSVSHNGQTYSTEYTGMHKTQSMDINHTGRLTLSWPQDKLTTTWSHESSGFKSFKSSVDASLAEDKNQRFFIKIDGENQVFRTNRTFSGDLVVLTPYQLIKDVQIHMNHNVDFSEGKGTLSGSINHNGQVYSTEFKGKHKSEGMDLENTGIFTFSWPEDRLNINWDHKNQGINKIKSALKADCPSSTTPHLQINIDIGHNSDVSGIVDHAGTFTMSWPKDTLVATWNHKSSGFTSIKSSLDASLANDKTKNVHLNMDTEPLANGQMVTVNVLTPLYTHPVKVEGNVEYTTYPVSTKVLLSWAPESQVKFDGSLDAGTITHMTVDAMLTTPFSSMESLKVTGLHKMKNGEYVTKANIAHKEELVIDFENRMRNGDSFKMVKTKIATPFKALKKWDTVLRIDVSPSKFEGNVEMEITPIMNKVDGLLEYTQSKDNTYGTVRITAPKSAFKSVEVSGSSKKNFDGTHTYHAEVKPSTVGVYSVSTQHRLQTPVLVEVTVLTPHLNFEHVGAKFSHSSDSQTGVLSRFWLKYSPDDVIDSEMKLQGDAHFDGSWTLKTPFKNFENNVFQLSNTGDNNDFNTHMEAQVGQQKVTADVCFTKTSEGVTGSLKVESSIAGLENIEGTMSIQGQMTDFKNKMLRGETTQFRGDAFIARGKDVFKVTFLNDYRKQAEFVLIKSTLSVITPFTEHLKLAFHHDKTEAKYGENNDLLNTNLYGKYGKDFVDMKTVRHIVTEKGVLRATSGITIVTPAGEQVKITINGFDGSRDWSKQYSQDRSKQFVIVLDDKKVPQMDVQYKISADKEEVSNILNLDVKGTWFKEDYSARVSHVGPLITNSTTTATIKGSTSGVIVSSNLTQTVTGFLKDHGMITIEEHSTFTYQGEKHSHNFTLHQAGPLNHMKGNFTNHWDDVKTSGNVETKIENYNDVIVTVKVNGLKDPESFMGFEVKYNNVDSNNFTTRFSTFDETTTYLEFKHEQTPNSIFTNCTAGTAGRQTGFEIVGKTTPYHSWTVNLQTPFIEHPIYELMSGSFNTTSVNGKLLMDKDAFTVSANRELSAARELYHTKLTTPYSALKLVELTWNNNTAETEGAFDMTVISGERVVKSTMGGSMEMNAFVPSVILSMKMNASLTGLDSLMDPISLNMNMTVEQATVKAPVTKELMVTFTKSHNKVIDVQSKTFADKEETRYQGNLDVKGTLFKEDYSVIVSHVGPLIINCTTTARINGATSGVIFSSNLTLVKNNEIIIVEDSTFTYQGKKHSHNFTLHQTGPLNHIKGNFTNHWDDVKTSGNVEVKFEAIRDVLVTLKVNGLKNPESFMGFEVQNNVVDFNNFTTRFSTFDETTTYLKFKHEQTPLSYVANVSLDGWMDPISFIMNMTVEPADADATVTKELMVTFTKSHNKVIDFTLHCTHGETGIWQPTTVTASIRQPWSMEYSALRHATATTSKHVLNMNWDRNCPTSNVVLTSTMTGFPLTSDSRDRLMTFTLARPTRTIGVEHSAKYTDEVYTSNGSVFWSTEPNSLVAYDLHLSATPLRTGGKLMDAAFSLALPTRTVGMIANYSDLVHTREVEGSMSWDMHREPSKTVGLKATLGNTQENRRALVTVTFPEDIKMISEVTLNQGDTMFDSKTNISYTNDPHKTLTLFSTIRNVQQPTWFTTDVNYNYSMEAGVTHPAAALDMRFESHFGQFDKTTSAGLALDFTTTEFKKERTALLAELNLETQKVQLLAYTPNMRQEIVGIVPKENPLRAEMVGFLDGTETFNGKVHMNSQNEIAVASLVHGMKQYVASAKFPDSLSFEGATCILNRTTSLEHGCHATQGPHRSLLVSTHLATPHDLVTRLCWDLDTMTREVKTLAGEMGSDMTTTQESWRMTWLELADQMMKKYQAVRTSLVHDSQPIMTFIEEEMRHMSHDLDSARSAITTMRQGNHFYMDTVLTHLESKAEYLNELTSELQIHMTWSLNQVLDFLTHQLKFLTTMPIKKTLIHWLTVTTDMVDNLLTNTLEFTTYCSTVVKTLKIQFDQLSAELAEMLQGLMSRLTTPLSKLMQNTSTPRDLWQWLKATMAPVGEQMMVPVKAMYRAVDKEVTVWLRNVIREVRQQVVWAAQYWEDDLNTLASGAARLAKEVVQVELHEMQNSLALNSPVTHYEFLGQSRKGTISFDVELPFELKRLDTMPAFSLLMNKTEHITNIITNLV